MEVWSCNIDLLAGYDFYYDVPLFGTVGGVGIRLYYITIRRSRKGRSQSRTDQTVML